RPYSIEKVIGKTAVMLSVKNHCAFGMHGVRALPPHEPSPHPDPLPSHRMGAEREQPADAIGFTEVCRAATGSGEQCAKLLRGNLCPPPSARNHGAMYAAQGGQKKRQR